MDGAERGVGERPSERVRERVGGGERERRERRKKRRREREERQRTTELPND